VMISADLSKVPQLARDTTPLSRVDLLRDLLSYEQRERLVSVAIVEVVN
jgi:hypothetical protein